MTLVTSETTDGVAVVTLDDAERRNALSPELVADLVEVLGFLEANDEVRAVVITGAPPAFCAGAHLGDLGAAREQGLRRIYEGFLRVARSPLPTIAAINGAAVGAGVNLALACDVRLAASSARIDTRFLALGIHPGGGHTWMLERLLGPQGTHALVTFGEVLDGAEAERVGLAWRCVPDGDLLHVASTMAARAAAAPPQLVARVRRTIGEVESVTSHEAAVDLELDAQLWSMDQPAFQERLVAARQRRDR